MNILVMDEDRWDAQQNKFNGSYSTMMMCDFVSVRKPDGRYQILKSRWFTNGDIVSPSLHKWILNQADLNDRIL